MKKIVPATTVFAVVLWGCTSVSSVLQANTNADDAGSRVSATAEALTNESLKQVLLNMGYEPKNLSKGYLLAIKQDTWTLNMQIVLSADSEKIGLNANLGKIEDATTVSAPQWMDLLVSNGNIDPSAFYFDKDQKKLYLHRTFDNRAVTPAVIRKQLDNFAANIRQTEALWKFTK